MCVRWHIWMVNTFLNYWSNKLTKYYSIIYITFVIFIGITRYLNSVLDVAMPPDQKWYCTRTMAMLYMSGLCSTFFIISMTFERFYSIIRPHKAASFNTVKKAKITIALIVILSILFNIPHLYITTNNGKSCVPFGRSMQTLYGQIYYWFSVIFNFIIPLVLLLSMNSVIIDTLHKRSMSMVVISGNKGQGQNKDHTPRLKNSERQMFVILLFVNFSFLIFTIPPYSLLLYINFVDYQKSPALLAGFYLFHSIGQKAYYTNYGINFYLYIISGKKFRSDVANLFKCGKKPLIDTSICTVSNSYQVIQLFHYTHFCQIIWQITEFPQFGLIPQPPDHHYFVVCMNY